MKVILLLTFCFFFNLCVLGQTDLVQKDGQVGVEQIYLAKDDGNGKAGETAEKFLTTDVPIYCIVQLNSLKSTTVKMNLVAVKVNGVKPGTKVITVSYTTDGQQSRVNFTGKPDGNWVVGNYRFDIFIDDKPAGNESFEIQELPAKNASAEKADLKRQAIRRFRKN